MIPLRIRGFPRGLLGHLGIVMALVLLPVDSKGSIGYLDRRAEGRPPAGRSDVQHAIPARRPDCQLLGHEPIVHRQIDGPDRLREAAHGHAHTVCAIGQVQAEADVLTTDDRVPVQGIAVAVVRLLQQQLAERTA